MNTYRTWWTIVAFMGALIFMPIAAWGDFIDGEWCSENGDHLIIEARKIVLPGGKPTPVDYDRHHLFVKLPQTRADGITAIDMVLGEKNTMYMRFFREYSEPDEDRIQIWRRCQSQTS